MDDGGQQEALAQAARWIDAAAEAFKAGELTAAVDHLLDARHLLTSTLASTEQSSVLPRHGDGPPLSLVQ